MKRLKSQKGAITLIALITILFLVSFLTSSYVIVANKVKTQKEMLSETKKIYEPTATMEEIYNSYFSNESVIPIYTVEQLMTIGTIQENVNINGKFYDFTNDENAVYVLMNDIKFIAEDLELQSDWIPLDENEDFLGVFDWNGYKVEATELDGSTKVYYQLPSTYRAIIKGLNSETTVVSYRDLEEVSTDIKNAADTGKISAVLKETIDGIETMAVIPTGFEISTTDGEDSISAGLVVYDGTVDNRNNEFVWIPITTNFSETYNFSTEYAEPIKLTYVSESSGGNVLDSQECLDYYYGANYYKFETEFNYVSHYNEMLSSVNKYNGFYIGRYETTIDGDGNIGSKVNTNVLTSSNIIKDGTNTNVNEPFYYRWWELYAKQRKSNVMGNGENIQTNMIWGQQWDAMLTFLGETQANSIIEGEQVTILKSAKATYNGLKDEMNNIYDLRRNARDWTAEAYDPNDRVWRGGYWNNGNNSASYRFSGTDGFSPYVRYSDNRKQTYTLYKIRVKTKSI